MSKRYELIVFDWDGTLMDSTRAIVNATLSACRDLGLTPPTEQCARSIIGLGLKDALRRMLPDLPPNSYQDLIQRYRFHYLSSDHELVLFDGVYAMLQELVARGYKLAVATGKTRIGLDRALEFSGLAGIFSATRTADECHSKPNPQMLDELMEIFFVDKTQTLMIGDTTHDILMAKNAGVDTLAVSYGAHPRVELEAEAPLACVTSIDEMADWLRRNA